MEYLTVGQIVRTIGLKGEIKIYPSTHFRDSRFSKGSHLFLLDNQNNVVKELTIKNHRSIGDCDSLIFNEINSIEEAQLYINEYLYVEKDNNFLKNDEYYFCDLINSEIYFDNGTKIGIVSKVEEFSSYATLRVKRNEGKDVLIPFVKAYIKDVNIEEKRITIKYIEGLL